RAAMIELLPLQAIQLVIVFELQRQTFEAMRHAYCDAGNAVRGTRPDCGRIVFQYSHDGVMRKAIFNPEVVKPAFFCIVYIQTILRADANQSAAIMVQFGDAVVAQAAWSV